MDVYKNNPTIYYQRIKLTNEYEFVWSGLPSKKKTVGLYIRFSLLEIQILG